jgi:hypothetical protein
MFPDVSRQYVPEVPNVPSEHVSECFSREHVFEFFPGTCFRMFLPGTCFEFFPGTCFRMFLPNMLRIFYSKNFLPDMFRNFFFRKDFWHLLRKHVRRHVPEPEHLLRNISKRNFPDVERNFFREIFFEQFHENFRPYRVMLPFFAMIFVFSGIFFCFRHASHANRMLYRISSSFGGTKI